MAPAFPKGDQLPENAFLNILMNVHKSRSSKGILRQIRNFLAGAILFLIAALATFVVMLSTDKDKIRGMLIAELNRRANTEFSAGDLHFSVIKDFPMATFRFEDVLVMEPAHIARPDTLTFASSVALSFNLLDFFRGEFNIRRLTLEDGMVFPKVDQHGAVNYRLWQNNTNDNTSGIHFDIRRIDLQNLHAKYLDKAQNQLVDIEVHHMRLYLKTSHPQLQFTAEGTFTSRNMQLNSTHFPENIFVDTKLEASIGKKSDLRIADTQVKIFDHPLYIHGDLQIERGKTYADMHVSVQDLHTESLIEDLPTSWRQHIKPYQLTGRLDSDIHISGALDDWQTPEILASYQVRQGQIKLPAQNLAAELIALEGTFAKNAHSAFPSSRITIHQLKASSDETELTGNLSLRNLKTPEISFEVAARVSPEKLAALFPHESLTHYRGQVVMDIEFAGSMSQHDQFTREDLLAARLSGEVTLEDVGFIVNNNTVLPYHQINAHLVFRDNNLHMNSLYGKAGSSDFAVSGVMHNVLPYLFLDGEQAVIQAQLQSRHINMDEILQDQTQEADTIYRLQLPSRLQLLMQAEVGDFQFREFRAAKVQGQARISERQFFADHLEFQTMGGEVTLEGLVDGRPEDHIHISCQAKLSDVDIHQLFFQTGNFGQTGIRHDHIHGRVTADLHFSSQWSPELDIDWSSMQTSASLTIEEGKLIDYHPLIALGRYIRTSDLSNVHFSTLENEIHIQNREITIPQMEIASSALDLQLSGKHTFDNEIDYRLQVLLSDVLAREHRERRNPQEQYGDIMDDGLHTTLFLQLSGDFNNPRFSYDHRGARDQWKDNLREEKENLRRILREEFRFLSRDAEEDTTEQSNTKERLQKQEAGEFIIEWEELD